MRVSETRVRTTSASRYLQQLCKHWSHKFAVEFTPEQGRISFAADRVCTLEAAPDHLRMQIEANDDAALARLEGVVIEHLERSAFREDLGQVAWRRSATA